MVTLKLEEEEGTVHQMQQLRADHLMPSLPHVAHEGDLSDFLVLKVQGEFVGFFVLLRLIVKSEDCPKVNVKIWNLDGTGQSPTLPVVFEHHDSLSRLHTCDRVQENKEMCEEFMVRRDREEAQQPTVFNMLKQGHSSGMADRFIFFRSDLIQSADIY